MPPTMTNGGLENIHTIKFEISKSKYSQTQRIFYWSTLQSKTHSNWILKNPKLYWGISPKLVDHWWDPRLCYVVSSSSWLWWEFLKICSNCYDYKLKRLCDEIFRVTKYYLDLEIEILDIYPFIALVETL